MSGKFQLSKTKSPLILHWRNCGRHRVDNSGSKYKGQKGLNKRCKNNASQHGPFEAEDKKTTTKKPTKSMMTKNMMTKTTKTKRNNNTSTYLHFICSRF